MNPRILKITGIGYGNQGGWIFLEEIRVSSVVFFGCFWEFLFCICVMLYVILCMSIVIHILVFKGLCVCQI